MKKKRRPGGSVIASCALILTMFVTGPRATAAAKEKVLYSFNGSNTASGSQPEGNIVLGLAGNLYGTTFSGGTGSGDDCSDGNIYGCGTAFELTPKAGGGWAGKVLHNFGDVGDGANPAAGLIVDSSGNLYGTTTAGGAYGCGTVFELTPNKTSADWTETILHSFCAPGAQVDGSGPWGGLVFDAAGNLYGTTSEGGLGQCSCGVAFELTPAAGGNWTEQVLYNFGDTADGSNPNAGLVLDAAGNLYGTTANGGSSCYYGFGCGVVFELSPADGGTWTEKLLYIFTEGGNPNSTLIFDKVGNLYGSTMWSGVFELAPNSDGSWTEKVISTSCCFPNALTLHSGDIYGTFSTSNGQCCGSVFELKPQADGGWIETAVYDFQGEKQGNYPSSALIFDSAGHLFGSTFEGGSFFQYGQPAGTVFEITP
jgi:uncharacterized repeat protein (TIGR03803 family)